MSLSPFAPFAVGCLRKDWHKYLPAAQSVSTETRRTSSDESTPTIFFRNNHQRHHHCFATSGGRMRSVAVCFRKMGGGIRKSCPSKKENGVASKHLTFGPTCAPAVITTGKKV